MYDIHCHILPGIDDGPDQMEDSLTMARLAAEDGTRTLVATPHSDKVAGIGGKDALAQRIHAFREEVASRGIELDVVMGAEHLLSADLLVEVQDGTVISINSSQYLLVEIDFFQWPSYLEEALFQLGLAGFTPFLAHPERQANIQQKPNLLAELVERGVITEVTGGSILGDFGRDAQKSAVPLLKQKLIHVIASDGHTPTSNRPPVMGSALAQVASLVGEKAARVLGTENPAAIIAGNPVTLPETRPACSWPTLEKA